MIKSLFTGYAVIGFGLLLFIHTIRKLLTDSRILGATRRKAAFESFIALIFAFLWVNLDYIYTHPDMKKIDIANTVSIDMNHILKASLAASVLLSLFVIIVVSIFRTLMINETRAIRLEAKIPDGAISVNRVVQGYIHFIILCAFAWLLSGYIYLSVR